MPSNVLPTHQHYISGAWQGPSVGSGIPVYDPWTEEVVANMPAGGPSHVDEAVLAARSAQSAWAGMPTDERVAHLRAIRDGLVARSEDIVRAIVIEMGAPVTFARAVQAAGPVGSFDVAVEMVESFPMSTRLGSSLVVREPIGVVGIITPWNFPLHQVCGKVAPALAAGCTVVVKPSEVAPLSSAILAEIVDASGLPPGVFNLVHGDGPTVGEAMAAHPGIDMISFTGSTRAGRRVGELAARTVKRVTLELGGKSANVILDDADLDVAVARGVAECYSNSGQSCAAWSRMLVPGARLAEVEELAAAAAAAEVVGDPSSAATTIGPLVSAVQRDRVQAYIRRGEAEGARLIHGGTGSLGFARGHSVRPTVFSGVSPDMDIAREEIFGPVLAILAYADDEAALAMANDSIYGLSGAVWSADADRAEAFARRMRTGSVSLNGGMFDRLTPFGGYRQSGNGREYGPFGFEEFLEVKSLLW
jgi:aldehyde dehydrogenase (NAD+)